MNLFGSLLLVFCSRVSQCPSSHSHSFTLGLQKQADRRSYLIFLTRKVLLFNYSIYTTMNNCIWCKSTFLFLPANLTPYFQLKIQHKFLSFQKTCWFLHSIKQYRNNSAVTKKSKLNADTNHCLLPLSSQAIIRQA